MYLFVYKTTHKNGRFYIGRHSTKNLDDGYLGSGVWVSGIKEKKNLSREILAEASSIVELKELEQYYIDLYWSDPKCMNIGKGANGFTSEEAKNLNEKLKSQGKHNFQKRADGSSISSDKVKLGTHQFLKREDGTSVASDRVKLGIHILQKRPDGTSVASDRVKRGTNPLQKRPDGSSLASDRVKSGTHHFLIRGDGTSLNSDRVKSGTHQFLKREDGTSISSDRVSNGTHNFLQNKGLVPCYNKLGEYRRISKEEYQSQKGEMETWDWVTVASPEGKKRKNYS